MASVWTYRGWEDGVEQPIVAAELIDHLSKASHPLTVDGFVSYADTAYAACRLLMLASTHLQDEALYFAHQTLEKYMKAILLADGQQITKTHGLEQLAAKLQPRHTEFGDAEYIELCRRLTPFEVAGRYPDHALVMWSYELGILTFLDNFVLHCRQLVGRKATITNKIKDLVDEPATNSVMAAAKAALGNQNAHLDTLASR